MVLQRGHTIYVQYDPIEMQESNDMLNESSSDEELDDEDLAEVRNG